jgi:hypothetical protein
MAPMAANRTEAAVNGAALGVGLVSIGVLVLWLLLLTYA